MRGRPFEKGHKPWNYNKVEKICEFCQKEFLITPNRALTAKHCSRKCHNTVISRNRTTGPKNPTWKTGITRYRQHTKSNCERCQSISFLLVHHKDRDRHNNNTTNLETLCRSCHAKEHDAARHLNN